MRQPTKVKVNSTKTLTTLIFLLMLFSAIPSFALFFNFDNNKKPQEWKEEGGKWKVENGMYIGEELNAVGGTFEGYYNDKLIVTMKHGVHKQGRAGLLVWQGSSGFDDISITGLGIPGLVINSKGKLASTWARIKALY